MVHLEEVPVAVPADVTVNPDLLMAKARGGDAHAFSRLIELYEEKAIHTAYAFLGNMEDARDAAQESFVKAYKSLGSFKGSSQFSTWLIRIVINQCKDALRKRKSRGFFLFLKPAEKDEQDPIDSVESKMPDSRKQLMDREIEQQIRKALETLPFQQKTVFTLRYLEGMSLEEIAETIGISAGAVKAHLWQAGQKMKKNLRHLMPAESTGGRYES